MRETKKARAARLQQAREAAAEANIHDLAAPWRKSNDRLLKRVLGPRTCKLHREEACVLCNTPAQ